MVREGQVIISSASRPAFGSSYLVTVLPVGGRAAASSSGTTVTLDSGHGFSVGDKFMVGADAARYIGTDSIQSTTTTSITINSALSVASGEFLVNLGPDTGTSSPNYDGGVDIFADMDYGSQFSGSTVAADSVGRYRYFHRGVDRWELVRSGQTPIALYLDTVSTSGPSTRYASSYATSGSGSLADPYLGWTGAVAANTVTMFDAAYYALASSLTLPAGATLQGIGPASVILFTAQNVAIVNATNAGDISVRNLKTDAQGDTYSSTPRNAFELTQGTGQNYLFDNVHVDDATKAGIRMTGGAGVKTNMIVRNCRVTNCDWHGIEFQDNTTHSQIVGNYVEGNNATTLGAQIYLSCSSNDPALYSVNYCTVRGNIVAGANDNGIRVLGNFCTVSDNTILNGNNDGIRLNGSYNTCTGNAINNVAECGVKWDGLTDSTITGNTIESAGIHGIHGRVLTASGRNVITGNLIRHSAIDGIRFTNISATESDTLVSSNNIQNNGTSGVDLGGAVRCHVISNVFRSNVTSITDADPANSENACFGNIHESIGLFGPAIDSAATITVPACGDRFTVNGTTSITDMVASWTGREITLVFAGILTFTDGNRIKLNANANFVTAAASTIKLLCDGTNWLEQCRSVN